MIADVQKSIERLRLTGKYSHILDHLGTPTSPSLPFIFELLFADEFVLFGLYPEYEGNINTSNGKRIDFIYRTEINTKFLFELVRPEMSEILQSEYDQKMYGDGDGVILSSDNANRYLRPEAQTIRLQEKLLGKVEKFPEPDDKNFSVIVVDCSNFHFGHFGDDDARISMYGVPQNPILLERWDGRRTFGLLEKDHPKQQDAFNFQRKVTAVVFVPILQATEMLKESKIIFNSLRSEHHRILFQNMCNNLQPIQHIKWL